VYLAGRTAGALFLAVLLSGCAARGVSLPLDPGRPVTGANEVYAALSTTCRGVRTLRAELGLAGRAGDSRIRGRALVGFDRTRAAMRLEGLAPFGPPAFILAAAPAETVLYFPRQARVLRHADAAEVLAALSGVRLVPVELLAVVTGCVVPDAHVGEGREHANTWVSVELGQGALVYARRSAGVWQLGGGRLDAWDIVYEVVENGLPRVVRLQSRPSTSPAVSLRITLSQIETNFDLDAAAFSVTVPDRAEPLTMDELRGTTALRDETP
jgi:hypothetical protein